VTELPSKICASCGRSFEWRRKWRDHWEQVRYCSDACRRRKVSDVDARLEERIVELLERRATGATLCPSEVARAESAEDWRSLMEPVRRAARRLCDRGVLEITQKGRRVDPSLARGPIRLRLRAGLRPSPKASVTPTRPFPAWERRP
jgi:hypothetical protein